MMAIRPEFNYRPEIDGMRAIAVLAVVLFHAGFACPGGYVGVDIFFVLSGFLITSLIWRDLETGRFTIAGFWERRARRIAPALIVVTIATMMAGCFLLLPQDLKSLGQAAASQALFTANRHYYYDVNYFSPASDEKALLHTWSLAVEEQFYLVMPFLLSGIFRMKFVRTRISVISLLIIGIAISFAASVFYVNREPPFAFYFLPTRAWELLLGSLVACLPTAPRLLERRTVREVAAVAGLALVIVPILCYTGNTPFPGLAALPPCLGTALFLWANERLNQGTPTIIGKFVSLRPLVSVGLISYSLYLWHWPFLAFGRYHSLLPASPAIRAAMVVLGILCGVLSWKYVESPFRARILGRSRKTMFVFTGAGLMIVFACGRLVSLKQGFPQRISAQAREYVEAISDRQFQIQLTAGDIRAGRLINIGAIDPTLQPEVLVWGDSHAMAALPAIDAFLKENGRAGRAATHSSTPPVLDWYTTLEWSLKKDSIDYNQSVMDYIRNHRIRDVILVASWPGYVTDKGYHAKPFVTALLATVRRLREIGAHAWILLDVPNLQVDIVRAVSRSIVSSDSIPAYCTRPTLSNRYDGMRQSVLSDIVASGGSVLDPKPRFLDPKSQYYVVRSNGVVLYRDSHHLTTRGAMLMLLPLLRTSLKLENIK